MMARKVPRCRPTVRGIPTIPSLPDNAHFNAASITAKSNQRGHAIIQKICEIDFLRGLVEDLILREFSGFQMRPKQVVLFIRERQENHITNRFSRRVGARART